MTGRLVIFSAPSGAGKTTIVNYLLTRGLNLEFSISATSRDKRSYEIDGKDYYFITAEEFKEKINNDEFLEWEEVYKDCFYGTLKSEVDRIWKNGNDVIFDVDVQGGLRLKEYFKERALAVFVMTPSIQHLEERLKARQSETEESFQKRVQKAHSEITFSDKFDTILMNENLETAFINAEDTVKEFLNNRYEKKL